MTEFGFVASLTVQNIILHVFYFFASLLFNGEIRKGCKNHQTEGLTNHSSRHPVKIILSHLRWILKRF